VCAITNTEAVLRLVVGHQDRIFRYLYSLCPVEEDARDLLQETCVALLRNAEAYDTSRPFLPWAYRHAHLEVLKHRERSARNKRVFATDVIELVARQRQTMDDRLHSELAELENCLDQLGKDDRRMIDARYRPGTVMQDVAGELGMSRRTLFRNLRRIRRLLIECVSGRLAEAAT